MSPEAERRNSLRDRHGRGALAPIWLGSTQPSRYQCPWHHSTRDIAFGIEFRAASMALWKRSEVFFGDMGGGGLAFLVV